MNTIKLRLLRWKINNVIHDIRYKIDKKYRMHHDSYMIHLQEEIINAFNLTSEDSNERNLL